MAHDDLTADDYGILGNAASQPDGRVRYGPDAPIDRVDEVRVRMRDKGLLIEHPTAILHHAEFEITDTGRQAYADRPAVPSR